MRILAAATLAAALAAPALALAQQGATPDRLGNIWDGKSHQPAPDELRAREQAAGLRGTQAQQRARDDEVNTLDKQILQRAQQGGNDGVMNGTAATAPAQ